MPSRTILSLCFRKLLALSSPFLQVGLLRSVLFPLSLAFSPQVEMIAHLLLQFCLEPGRPLGLGFSSGYEGLVFTGRVGEDVQVLYAGRVTSFALQAGNLLISSLILAQTREYLDLRSDFGHSECPLAGWPSEGIAEILESRLHLGHPHEFLLGAEGPQRGHLFLVLRVPGAADGEGKILDGFAEQFSECPGGLRDLLLASWCEPKLCCEFLLAERDELQQRTQFDADELHSAIVIN